MQDIPHISHVVERLVPSFYIPVDSILSFSKLDETSVAIMQRHFLRNGRMGYVCMLCINISICGSNGSINRHPIIYATVYLYICVHSYFDDRLQINSMSSLFI